MCLSVSEQQQLDTIGASVSQSDAQLASMLATFARLTAGEPMPDREQLTRRGSSRAGRSWHAIGAAMARLITWLDRMDTPRARPAEPDREHHAA